MIELIRFDLQKKDECDDFYDLFSSYLSEVCDEEEYQENIDDLHNDELNAQMIEQTLQEHNPYFVMRIVENEVCVGLISYSYDEERNKGFINNFLNDFFNIFIFIIDFIRIIDNILEIIIIS